MAERADWIISQFESFSTGKRKILAGYSRGASACIMAAERLKKNNVSIDSMFLFDPVARHATSGGEIIPENVNFVAVVRRKLDRQMIDKYSHKVSRIYEGTSGIYWVDLAHQ